MIDIVVLFVAYLLSQFYRSFLAVLTPALQAELGVTPSDLSWAVGVWFLAFAVTQVPVGVLLDRIGPRRTLGYALMIGGGGGAFLFSIAEGPWGLIAGMAMLGSGCAPMLTSGMFLFARRFSPARFATLTGLMIGIGSLGNVASAAPFAYAAEAFGWRASMASLGGCAVVLAFALLMLIRDPRRVAQAPGSAGLGGFVELLRMPVIWPLLPVALANYAVSAGIRGLWAGPYLADVHGFDALAIGVATAWMALAMAAGNFVYGPLDRLLGTRKWVILVGNAGGAACTAALALASPGPVAAVALLAGLGFLGSSYAVLSAHFRAFVPERLTGRGVTLSNVFGIGGVGLGQFASGALFDAAGAGAPGHDAVFLWYSGTLAAALVIYLFSRDAKP
ncbi:MAG: MFS transporter [Pseudomonadota bacterium]